MTGAPGAFAKTAGHCVRRIAVEEGFTLPEVWTAARRVLGDRVREEPGEAFVFGLTAPAPRSGPAGPPPWLQDLMDLDERRLADMDACGIDMQLLLLASPGVQIFEAGEARDLSMLANDRLASAVARHANRLAGLAAIPPQDPLFAAAELERAVRTLGLRGAVINSHTGGEYLDGERFEPILDAAERLEVPIYIHPRAPSPAMVGPYLDQGLVGAIWGYAVEVGLHALRLIFSGTLDRHPRLRLVIGHMGEGIPFFLDRIDTHYGYGAGWGRRSRPLRRRPSEYFREHFCVTTSGMNWAPALRLAIDTLGSERVLFAADYPFEDANAAVERISAFPMTHVERTAIEADNARRVFGLPVAAGSGALGSPPKKGDRALG